MIDRDTVKKILELSSLELDNQGSDNLALQLSKILAHMKALDAVDTTGVVPMFYGVEEPLAMREDEVDAFDHNSIKNGNPYIKSDHYSVPNIIEDEE